MEGIVRSLIVFKEQSMVNSRTFFCLVGNEVSGGRHHPPSASNQSGVYVLVVSIQFPSPTCWRFQHLQNSSKIFLCVSLEWEGFPDSSVGEECACNAGDSGSISGSWRFAGERIGYPLQYSGLENSMYIVYVHMYIREGNGTPTPVLLPGKSHGQRSLVGCSPWGHTELDTTERVHFHFHICIYTYICILIYTNICIMYSPWGHKELDMTEPLSLSLEWEPGLSPKAALWFLGFSFLVSATPLFLH